MTKLRLTLDYDDEESSAILVILQTLCKDLGYTMTTTACSGVTPELWVEGESYQGIHKIGKFIIEERKNEKK